MYRKVIKDSLPTVISLMLAGMYSMIDGLFIGKAAGDTGLAAVNIAWPIVAVLIAAGMGTGVGGSVLLSIYRGQGNKRNMMRAHETTITLLLVDGICLTLLLLFLYPFLLKGLGAEGDVFVEAAKYSEVIAKGSLFLILGAGVLPLLRNRGMALHAMIGMMTGILINIGLNYYLMFQRGMGIQGAAYGTVTAQGVVAFIGIMLLYRDAKKFPELKLDGEMTKRIFQIAVPAFGVSIAPSVALIFTNWQCLLYGGETTVACYAVISYIVFPVQSMLSGIGEGTQPLMSYLNGAEKYKDVQKLRESACRIAVVLGGVAFMVSIILSPKVSTWFGLSEDAASFFKTGMRISAVSFWTAGITKLNVTYLNATLQTKRAAILTYVESLVVTPLLLYTLPVFIGINGIWSTLPAVTLCLLVIYKMMEEKKGYEKPAEI
ncbi:MAG: MATE family efflux transporter [Muricomes sp.]